MRISIAALVVTLSLLLYLTLRSGAQTFDALPVTDGPHHSPVVAELFTSQSCSSCPPAEALFSELAERPDLIVLEWHVDYWDRLIHGRAGAWKDPFSDAAFTARQRQYNRAIRNTARVFTPQAVINGRTETIASQRNRVEHLLSTDRHQTTQVEIAPLSDQLEVRIAAFDGAFQGAANIYQLTLLPHQTTPVPRGENRGAILSSRNVVLAAQKIGIYHGTAMSVPIDRPDKSHTCAILIQEKRGAQLGPVIGASYCH